MMKTTQCGSKERKQKPKTGFGFLKTDNPVSNKGTRFCNLWLSNSAYVTLGINSVHLY